MPENYVVFSWIRQICAYQATVEADQSPLILFNRNVNVTWASSIVEGVS